MEILKSVYVRNYTVDWDFNFSALRKLEYGEKLIHVVKDVYTNIQSKIIKANGLLSDPFTVTQEV